MAGRRFAPLVALLLVAGGLVAYRLLAPTAPATRGAAAVRQAWQLGRSGIWVEVQGRVTRVLPDDTRPPRHQRFILDLGGHTVLVTHNVDLAPRVPLRVGEEVRLRGRYEWNSKGGVIHWTHRDPRGRRRGGWIQHRGRIYR